MLRKKITIVIVLLIVGFAFGVSVSGQLSEEELEKAVLEERLENYMTSAVFDGDEAGVILSLVESFESNDMEKFYRYSYLLLKPNIDAKAIIKKFSDMSVERIEELEVKISRIPEFVDKHESKENCSLPHEITK